MNDFKLLVKEKSNEELLQIIANSQDWQPEFVTLAKQELEEVRGVTPETMNEFVKNSIEKSDVKKEKIRGWLVFFMFAIGLGSLIAIFRNLFSLSFSDYDLGQGYAMQMFGFISEVFLQVGMFTLAIYAIISLFRYKPNAVALAKIYLIVVFATNLLGLLSGELESHGTGFDSVYNTVVGLIWGIIWFIYLDRSEQVKTLFPKENRKLYKRDKVILTSAFAPVVIWLISVWGLVLTPNNEQSIIIVNHTGYEIHSVYISPTADTSWGNCRLASDFDGQVFSHEWWIALQLPHPLDMVNRYDIRLVDLDGD